MMFQQFRSNGYDRWLSEYNKLQKMEDALFEQMLTAAEMDKLGELGELDELDELGELGELGELDELDEWMNWMNWTN